MKTKNIKILSRTPIRAKGGIYGPILTPYTEKTSIIFAMITQGVDVVEVLKDGTEVKLTTINFDKDNENINNTIDFYNDSTKPVNLINKEQELKGKKIINPSVKTEEIIPDLIEKK